MRAVPLSRWPGLLLLGGLLAGWTVPAVELVPVPALGLRLARGFVANQYAGPQLANDIRALTLDDDGQVTVAIPGAIKILRDENQDGIADRAVLFAHSLVDNSALLWVGDDLYAIAGRNLIRYTDADEDGVADGPAEVVLELEGLPEGSGGLGMGPDGSLYIGVGAGTVFGEAHASLPTSPLFRAEGGAILRLLPAEGGCELVAQGFCRPTAPVFTARGDMLVADGGAPEWTPMPWSLPARLIQVGHGQHHGWRLMGAKPMATRMEDGLDTVAPLLDLGWQEPAGLVLYQHHQFPPYFRQGLFLLCWDSGEVLFTPLEADGTGYETDLEPFIEPLDTSAFAPVAGCVGVDGSLFLASGGRQSPGAVYQVRYVGEKSARYPQVLANPPPFTVLDAVISAPQPLEAWSQERWLSSLGELSADSLAAALASESVEISARLRAVECLVWQFGGLSIREVRAGLRATPAAVRARTAWAVGRLPGQNCLPALLPATLDAEAEVRLAALEALADHFPALDRLNLLPAIQANLSHPDKPVRLAVARLASRLPEREWTQLWTANAKSTSGVRLTLGLAATQRPSAPRPNQPLVDWALQVFAAERHPELRLDALRLAVIALGEENWVATGQVALAAVQLAEPLPVDHAARKQIRTLFQAGFPTGQEFVDLEFARLLALAEGVDVLAMARLLDQIKIDSDPENDLLYLTLMAASATVPDPASRLRLARALLGLGAKLSGRKITPGPGWPDLTREVALRLEFKDRLFGETLRRLPEFQRPGNRGLLAAPMPSGASALSQMTTNAAKTNLARTLPILDRVDWSKGVAARGKTFFQNLGCAECHAGVSAFGPSLVNVANGVSPRQLLQSVMIPSQQISPSFRGYTIKVQDGRFFTGKLLYEGRDYLLLQSGPEETHRLSRGAVVARIPLTQSLMPARLVDRLMPGDLADLAAYLRQLKETD